MSGGSRGSPNLRANMSTPAVYMAQRDFAVGDIAGNRQKLLHAAQKAHAAGAAAVLSPELALSGYCPEDMLYDDSFMEAVERGLPQFAAEAPPLPIVAGLPLREDGRLYDAAALICNGRVRGVYKKVFLPNYSVFDERRYFSSGDNPPLLFESGGVKFAVQICADVWENKQAERAAKTGAAWTLSLNASPFYLGKHRERLAAAAEFVRISGGGLFYCNMVGGQDELIFDGASFAMDQAGKIGGQFPALREYEGAGAEINAKMPEADEAAYESLVMGVRDYAAKTGFARGAVLGLSGGVDSALTAAVAADALGPERVLAAMMPSCYTSAESLEDAAAIARNLGVELLNIPIGGLMKAADDSLSSHMRPRENDATMENVQARLRGMLLMALSNNRGLLLLATGNKSELACGYATLYGDMCGGFAPLKDASKTRVWSLARFRNKRGEAIPPRVISRAPSAELRENQTDEQTLPPYADIDRAIGAHIENGVSRPELARDFNGEFIDRFFNLLAGGEHKRRQGAIGPKITRRAFGRDWRMPVANRYRHD
ncbi:MAG: NAD+ synthase [Gammaproteobacteria bacterium]